MKNKNHVKKQDEIWLLISSIGISIMIIEFSRRLFFISVQPWWTHFPTTSLENASPIWMFALSIFIFVNLFFVKKVANPSMAFLIWLSCSLLISIPIADPPFYIFLIFILVSSLYLAIKNLRINK